MLYPALLKSFQEILKNASDEDLKEIIKPARPGIECEKCSSKHNVSYIDLGVNALFFCETCLKKHRDYEPEIKESKGLRKRFQILMRDKFRCVYCGRSPREDGVKLEVDHVHPKSKGGTDDMENLVTACWECNQGKTDLIIEEN